MFVLRLSCGLFGCVSVSAQTPEMVDVLSSSPWGGTLVDGVLCLAYGRGERCQGGPTDPGCSGGDLYRIKFHSLGYPVLPAFHVDHAEFEVRGDMLMWEVPHFYELPWPMLQPCHYDDRPDNVEDLARTVSLRVASNIQAGLSAYDALNRTPTHVRRLLGHQVWTRIIQEYRQ